MGNPEILPESNTKPSEALPETGLESIRGMFSLLPMPASLVDLSSHRILALNAPFAQSLHLPMDFIVGRTPEELGIRPDTDDRDKVLAGTANGRIHHAHRRTRLPDGIWAEYVDSSRRILVDGIECLFSCYEPASRLVAEAELDRKAKEAELREREERLRLVLDATSDGIFDWDIPSGSIYFSPACYTMLGYEPGEFASSLEAWGERIHPNDLAAVQTSIQTHFENFPNPPYSIELRMLHRDGSWVWILSRGKVVLVDAEGKAVRMVGAHKNISHRKCAEDKYRKLFENLTTGFALLDIVHDGHGQPVDFRFLEANRAFEKLTGLKASDLLGRTVKEVLPGTEWFWFETYRKIALGSEQSVRSEFFSAKFGRWFETTVYLPSLSQFAVLGNDVTDRKLADEAIRRSEEMYRIVADMSLDLLSRHDLSGIFRWASPASRQILSIEPGSAVGRDVFEFVASDDHPAVKGALEELLRTGQSHLRYRVLRNDGTTLWVESLWSLARDESGNPSEIHCSTRDITERQEAESQILELNETLERRVLERTNELEAAMKELESFSYSISHDLRSPLRAIDGFSQALLEDAGELLPAELRMYLDRIRAASQHMGHLIDDLLELSRSCRVEMVRRDIDISTLANQILEDLARQSPHREAIFKVPPAITIQGDCVLVRSVLENLIGNAWKYSSLEPESVIELSSKVVDGRRWIEIRDNGIGFDMAHANKLFGTFHRLHPLGQFEGTGIGLATVRKIVERHGGAVDAVGVPQQGARFSFTLDPLQGAAA